MTDVDGSAPAGSAEKLRCLWLMRQVPVRLDAGDFVYSVRLADALARSGVTVDALGLCDVAGEPPLAPRSNLSWECVPGAARSRAGGLISLLPLEAARHATLFYRGAIEKRLRAQRYDAVILDHYGLGWAVDEVLHLAPNPPKVIHISHNHEETLWRELVRDFDGNPLKKAALSLNALKMKRFERRLVRSVDLVTAITNEDANAFAQTPPKQPPIVIRPGYDGHRVAARAIDASTRRKVVILGSFRWVAKQLNLENFLSVADQIFADNNIALEIIGDVPDELKERWASRLRATKFLGFVDDIDAVLADARMGIVAESAGGGFKLKLLDYVFRRLPVVAIDGSLSGIDELAQSIALAAGPRELAEQACALIDDLDRLNAMHEGAFSAASQHFSWERNGETIRDAISSMLTT